MIPILQTLALDNLGIFINGDNNICCAQKESVCYSFIEMSNNALVICHCYSTVIFVSMKVQLTNEITISNFV